MLPSKIETESISLFETDCLSVENILDTVTTPNNSPTKSHTLGSFSPSGIPSETSSALPSDSPTIASFFEKHDGRGDEADEKDAQCAVTDGNDSVCSVDNSIGNSAAKHQCYVVVGENSIEIGSVDLCIASKVFGETSAGEVHNIESEFHECVLASHAPSDMTIGTPTVCPAS